MNSANQSTHIHNSPARLLYPVIMLMPFILLGWLFPWLGWTNFGFDYWHHHIQDQMELAFALKTGTFPLFAPGYFHGQTAYVLSEGQPFHPFFHVVRHLPGYWGGHAADWTMLLHLLGLAGAQAALFCFLRRSGLGGLLSFFLSTVTVYNLRLLFLSWFGSPLEAWSGHILLSAAIGCYYLRPTAWKGPLLIIGATFWLLGCGHPVWVFYGLVTVAIFTLLLPFFLRLIAPADNTAAEPGENGWRLPVLSFWGRVAVFGGLGAALASAWIVPYYFDFIATNAGIVDQGYQWSLSLPEPAGEIFNNFFLPLRTGYAMFAGTPLYLALVLIPVLKLFRVKIPVIIWVILGLVLLIFLYMLGDATPLHFLAWKYFPLHDLIRGPSRMAFALPLLFMMPLAWLLSKNPAASFYFRGRHYRLPAVVILGAASLSGLVLYPLCLPEGLMTDLAPLTRLNWSRLPAWSEPLIFITGLLAFLCLALFGLVSRPRKKLVLMGLFGISCLYILLIFLFNPLYYSPLAVRQQSPTLAELRSWKKTSLNIRQEHFYLNPGRGSRLVNRQLRHYFVETGLGKIYRRATAAEDLAEAYQILNRNRQPDEVVIVNPDKDPAIPSPDRSCEGGTDRVVLEYGSYNRLVFSATAACPSWFVCARPWSGHWTARVNGDRERIYPANGVAQAVRVPAGTSRVEFRYQSPAAVRGTFISCLVLALLGCWVGFLKTRQPAGSIVAVGAVIVAAGLFGLWRHSLYAGHDLDTAYSWESPRPDASRNIAYGKPTTMSSYKKGDLWFPLRYNSRHAVDGNTSDPLISSAHTDLEKEPWWQVDLQAPARVKRVVVYLTPPYAPLPFNQGPLWLLFSRDESLWRARSIDSQNQKIVVSFEEPVLMRYLRIQATGRCVLSLREVEVYVDKEPS